MLDAFIIEQIRSRREKAVDNRPTLQLPLPPGREPMPTEQEQDSRPNGDEETGQRGVVIIDFA